MKLSSKNIFLIWAFVVFHAFSLSVCTANSELRTDSAAVMDLILRAEVYLKIGAREHGAGRWLEKSEELLSQTAEMLSSSGIDATEKHHLERQLMAVREDLDIVVELNGERFYGVFPLVRLTTPTLTADEGLLFTEQLFHSPDDAAVMKAATGVNESLGAYPNPQVVWRSVPANRQLENLAAEVLRGGHAWSHSRRSLVAALSREQLEAFDSGYITPELIDHLTREFDTVHLTVLTIGEGIELEDGAAISITGDVFTPGEVVQGSPLEATVSLRVDSFSNVGYAWDRRDQLKQGIITELFMFLLALFWSSRISWSVGPPPSVPYRLAAGTALYFFGRFSMVLIILMTRKYAPAETALAVSALWWPAFVGLVGIVLLGLVAWISQARLTNVIAGARGARAVGSIFALTSLGAASYFVMPLLLLDGAQGLANLVPHIISSLSLALLFGFATRTGPPVPHYFAVIPTLMAPLAGLSLFMASTALLWCVAGLSLLVCAIAWTRHRIAVANGWEEVEPSEAQAAQADQDRLLKLHKQLSRSS